MLRKISCAISLDMSTRTKYFQNQNFGGILQGNTGEISEENKLFKEIFTEISGRTEEPSPGLSRIFS